MADIIFAPFRGAADATNSVFDLASRAEEDRKVRIDRLNQKGLTLAGRDNQYLSSFSPGNGDNEAEKKLADQYKLRAETILSRKAMPGRNQTILADPVRGF